MTAKADNVRILQYLKAGAPGVKYFPGPKSVKHFTQEPTTNHFFWDLFFLALLWGFLGLYYPPELLFSPTITAGGDTPSHYFTASFLTEYILHTGKISGWCHGNLAGFPMLQYYFPAPFLLMSGLSTMVGLPVAFKLVTALGVFMLPASVYGFFRLLRQLFPVPIVGACFSLIFLFNEGNKMWGGNIPSTMAGEFCYSIGFSLAILWMGMVYRTMEKPTLRQIVLTAAFLALVGLSHAYALLFAGFGSGFFLLTKSRFKAHLNTLLKIHGLAFCLLGFWIMPLIANLPWTTKFNILWIFHSWQQAMEEIFPAAMLPFIALTLLATIVALVLFLARKGKNPQDETALPFCLRPTMYLWGLILCGVALYFAGYRARVVDVRFIPFFQLFLIVGGAMLFQGRLVTRNSTLVAALLAAIALLSTTLWVDGKETFIRSWVKSNYEGVEVKPLWPAFKAVNDYLKGDWNDPRVQYEHSTIHQGAGSVRAFENLPLFSGRSTLECVYIQASVPAPFIFYIQSETCQRPSTPIPEVFFSRFNLKRGAEHMRYFNVSHFVAAESPIKQALEHNPDFFLEFMAPPYAVYGLEKAPRSYVAALQYKPVLLPLEGWMQKAYAWFRLGDLEVTPVFADHLSREEQSWFIPAGDAAMRSLPSVSLPESPSPAPRATMLHEKIAITGAQPGRPLLVKASYHPGWKASGGEKIFLAGPGFMLLFPKSPEVTLTYGPTSSDWIGKALTLTALLWLVLCLLPFSRGLTGLAGRLFNHYAIVPAVPLLLVMAVGAGLFLSREAPEFPAVPYNKGLEYFRDADYDEAIKVFRDILDRHGQSLVAGEAAYHLAMCYYRQEDYAGALRELEETLRLYPETPRAAEIRYHMGLCRMQQKRFGQARQAFDRTVDEFPGSIWGRLAAYHHAMSLFRERHYANALASLDRLLSLLPERPMAAEAFYHKGLCHLELGEIQEARQDFQLTRSHYDETLWAEHAQYQYGLSFFREQDFDNMVLAMKELLNQYPKTALAPEAWYHMGLGHLSLDMPKQARLDFTNVVEKSPGSSMAAPARDRLKELDS
ncbi:MAG: tetratricopeptide repeat protein [Desulfatibacillum sp.]|nr:tetratricopeptide repeat protein [Desulfatibacillum sp.]